MKDASFPDLFVIGSAGDLFAIEQHARSGNLEPLAKHIETGGQLDAPRRSLLAAILRGELRFSRGNRRTYAQELRERNLAVEVWTWQLVEARRNGLRGSKERALRRVLAEHRGLTKETLKKYVARLRLGVGKSALVEIDNDKFRAWEADFGLEL